MKIWSKGWKVEMQFDVSNTEKSYKPFRNLVCVKGSGSPRAGGKKPGPAGSR